MNKKILHISIIIAILLLNLLFLPNDANADSIAGINCPSSVNLNENFSVSLILPSNAYAAEATISVKFADGSTSSAKLVYVQGMSDFPNSVTLTAKSSGTATVTASNIIISDANSNPLENGGNKSQNLNVVAPATNTETAKFTEVNETVYTTERCNIRESYSTSSNKIATVNKNTALTRTGVGDNGWSRISYNGKTCYVYSQYLTTEEIQPEFTTVNETMYATQSCNLRASWSTSSEKVGYLDEGQEVTRIAVGDNGWSKIKYNGKEVYIATRLLQSEPVEDNQTENEVANETTNEVTNETVETQDELATIQEEIGVLPEVGNNIGLYIFSTIAIITLSIASYGIYYTNKEI